MFHQKAEGNPVGVGQLFEGFRRNTAQLVLISVWTTLGIIAIIAILFGLGYLIGALDGFAKGSLMNPLGFFTLPLLLLILVGLLLYIPLIMAQWIAPTLVILHGIKAIDAMKLSFKACLNNMAPLLILGLVAILMIFIAMLFIGFSVALLLKAKVFMAILILVMVIVELIFMLVLTASNYVAYRSVMTNQPLT